MPPDVVKSKKVTFAQSLPMGTRATFTHDGEIWIAYPAKKNQQIHGLVDRLMGIHTGITEEMTRWINKRPADADLAVYVLKWTAQARKAHAELAIEKVEAFTQ